MNAGSCRHPSPITLPVALFTCAACATCAAGGGVRGHAVGESGETHVSTWVDVTPSNVSLTRGSCGNYGTQSIQVDPNRPADLYAQFMCQGVWKSSDAGRTWTGPINVGTNGAIAGDCAGGIALASAGPASTPTIDQSCIRGLGTGFWRSIDGGVDFTRFDVEPGGPRQDFYPPAVDPYDARHLIMAGHEMNLLVQSIDGGESWASVTTDPGMKQKGGTASIHFIDTSDKSTTRTTWLWLAQLTGGTIGTWRTPDGGGHWTRVDSNEHRHGSSQTYQAAPGAAVYMAGGYSASGSGVLRSDDLGVHWAHEGSSHVETIVFGTPKVVYSMHGWAAGAGKLVEADLEVAAQPGTGTWTERATPAAMLQGPAQAAVTNDGIHHVIVTANWNSGLWRYVEP
jgi:hypothetical protein